jgi:hypothetical protein
MRCQKVIKLTEAYLLDELDSKTARELEAHYEGCKACMSEKMRISRVISSLRALPYLTKSATRRETVLAALDGVRITGRRSPWGRIGRWVAVAVIFVSIGIGLLIFTGPGGREGFTLQVKDVKGKALIQRDRTSCWETVKPGVVLREGDWLLTESYGPIHLSGAGGEIIVSPGSSLRLGFGGTDGKFYIMMNRGYLYGEFSPSDSVLTIIGPENDQVTVRRGVFEVGLRYAISLYAPPAADLEGYKLSFSHERLRDVLKRLEPLINKRFLLSSPLVGEKRINFCTLNSEPEALFQDFKRSMEEQGLVMVYMGGDKYKLIPVIDATGGELGQRLFVRVSEGEANIKGSKGRLDVASMEEGSIDAGGYPFKRCIKGEAIAAWRNASVDLVSRLASGKIPLPMLEIGYFEENKDGTKIVHYSLTQPEQVASLGDRLTAIAMTPVGLQKAVISDQGGEIVIPIRLVFIPRLK